MNRKLVWLALPVVVVVAVVVAILRNGAGEPQAQAVVVSGPKEAGFATETVTDEQGAVTVAVTPLNLNTPGETLDFEVALDTHSVDLGMDLAELATLSTDTGLTVASSAWDAPSGGHHVSGTLSFPAVAEGRNLREGTSKVTVLIRGVDADERRFTWALAPAQTN